MGTILVFTDRAHRRRSAAAILARAGHRTQEAANADQALAALRGNRIDLLLIDLLMPHPGGYPFVCELYARHDLALPRMAFLAAAGLASEVRLLVRVGGLAGPVAEMAAGDALASAAADALSQPPPVRARSPGRDRLYPLVSRLCGRIADLEQSNARLHARAAMHAAQLDDARSALDREVARRIDVEERLARQRRIDAEAVP